MRQFLQSAIGGRGAAGPNTSHGLDTATWLPDGELNPGLLRDRQGSLPLDYQGLDVMYK